MAWGLEARVPFLDKSFLDIAMNVDPKEKMFSKGSQQQVDEDGCPKMEKVRWIVRENTAMVLTDFFSTSSGRRSTAHPTASLTCPSPSSGAKRSSSPMVSVTLGSMGMPHIP